MRKYPRLLNLPKQQSIFLFGARNTGKSALLQIFEIIYLLFS